jgi:enhancing lycopene biosynthesis protein 2
MAHPPKIAVILAGCGHMDGSEVREAVLTLLALDQHGAEVQCLAPDASQFHVIDHAKGEPEAGAIRNLLAESSRIARAGNCQDLAGADPASFDALFLPGGFGVAKNLCTFALAGPAGTVRPDLKAFVQAFFAAGKPVGAVCIAPALVAMILADSDRHATLTLGNDPASSAAVEKLGARHKAVATAREIVVDDGNNLVTAPAYMFGDARLSDVWIGIERCVAEVVRRAGQ